MPVPHDLVHRPVKLESIPVRKGEEIPKLIDFLPHAFPPTESIPIDVVDVQTVAAATTVTIAIVNTLSNRAVLRFFGNESTAAPGYADLRWTIVVNGKPYWPYVAMRESRGLISNPDPIVIVLPKSTVVQVQVQNLAAAANWEAKTRLKGWLW